jgi:multidrug efflux system outer membrane protein
MTRSSLPLFAALCLLAACQTRLPPVSQPALPRSAPLAATSVAMAGDTAGWPGARWWERYGDSTLNGLIERALKVSPTLTAAAARQARAVAAVELQASASGLKVDGQAQVQRQRMSDNGLLPPKLLGISWYSMSELGLNIDYRPDFWHLQSTALRAAGAAAQASAAERAQLGTNLSVSVAQLYYTLRQELAARDLALRSVAALERQQRIAEARKATQLGGSDDVRRYSLQVLAARDRLGGHETLLALQRAALAELLDETPDQLPAIAAAEPLTLPLQLPSDASLALVARRGDLSAARWRVEAGFADATLARQAWLPNISLRALLGVTSRDIGSLLSAGSASPAFTLAAALPIHDGGARRARFHSAQADMDLAVANYQALLLTAARAVNEALALRTAAAIKLDNGRAQVREAEGLRDSAALQLRLGLIDARPSLSAELQLLDSRTALLQTEHELIDADLALIRALGGGYEDPHRE